MPMCTHMYVYMYAYTSHRYTCHRHVIVEHIRLTFMCNKYLESIGYRVLFQMWFT